MYGPGRYIRWSAAVGHSFLKEEEDKLAEVGEMLQCRGDVTNAVVLWRVVVMWLVLACLLGVDFGWMVPVGCNWALAAPGARNSGVTPLEWPSAGSVDTEASSSEVGVVLSRQAE